VSETILWAAVRPGKTVATDTPSATICALQRGFGDFPCELGAGDMDVLRGMLAAGIQGIGDIIGAIERHGDVRVWSES
jgi:hypothetical protein